MAEAKIEIKVGGLTFAGEGGEKWLSEQLDKLLAKAGELAAATVPPTDPGTHEPAGHGHALTQPKATTTLASYLTAKNASTKQVRRFLATAEWLKLKGNVKLATADVSKALSENHQSKLGNPADCLNQNVGKGFCEKNGDHFYVTPEGRTSLG